MRDFVKRHLKDNMLNTNTIFGKISLGKKKYNYYYFTKEKIMIIIIILYTFNKNVRMTHKF